MRQRTRHHSFLLSCRPIGHLLVARGLLFFPVFLYPKKRRPTADFLGAISRSDTGTGAHSFQLAKTASFQEHKVNVRDLVFIGASALSASYRALAGVPFFVPLSDKELGFANDFSGERLLPRAIFGKKRSMVAPSWAHRIAIRRADSAGACSSLQRSSCDPARWTPPFSGPLRGHFSRTTDSDCRAFGLREDHCASHVDRL